MLCRADSDHRSGDPLPNSTLKSDEALACYARPPRSLAPTAVPRANATGASASQLNAVVLGRSWPCSDLDHMTLVRTEHR